MEYTYDTYISLIKELLAQGKTTGNTQSEKYIAYTQLNISRMERIAKTYTPDVVLKEKLKNISSPQQWIVITEAWCGDSAQIVPIIYKMQLCNQQNINLKLFLRDDNPTLMNQYLTNGSMSIPKWIVRDENHQDIFVWGPRPQPAVAIYETWKKSAFAHDKEIFEKELHGWYAKDKGKSIEWEVLQSTWL